MSKNAAVHVDIDPNLKVLAEGFLKDSGITVAQAITLFYKQIVAYHGLPFSLNTPNAETLRTFGATDAGEELTECKDADHMFDKLGI